MKSLNEEFDSRLFSLLIQTVLYCRLSVKNPQSKKISNLIQKLKSSASENQSNLNFGLQLIQNFLRISHNKINNLLKQYFQRQHTKSYCIELEIFSVDNNKKIQNSQIRPSRKIEQKWIFRKQKRKSLRKAMHSKPSKRQQNLPNNQLNSDQTDIEDRLYKTDLIPRLLDFLKSSIQNDYSLLMNNNTVNSKGYYLIVKNLQKNKSSEQAQQAQHVQHYVLYQQGLPHYYEPKNQKTHSLIMLPGCWAKQMASDSSDFLVNCYFHPLNSYKLNSPMQSPHSQLNNRKISVQTQDSEKPKENSSPFISALKNLFLGFRKKKGQKKNEERKYINKNFDRTNKIEKPHFQSVYEEKDEEMNVYVLSPRKLSNQQSPKAKVFQQEERESREKVNFQIAQDEDNTSNASSEGFEILQQNGELDSIKQQKLQNASESKEVELSKENKQIAINQSASISDVLKNFYEIEQSFIQELKILDEFGLFQQNI